MVKVVDETGNVSYFFFQAEDGIRDAQESRGLGDVYKRQDHGHSNVRGQPGHTLAGDREGDQAHH